MSSKVVRSRELADSETRLAALAADPVPRVRAAALLALGRVGEVEHEKILAEHLTEIDPEVRVAAAKALDELEKRLDLRC